MQNKENFGRSLKVSYKFHIQQVLCSFEIKKAIHVSINRMINLYIVTLYIINQKMGEKD